MEKDIEQINSKVLSKNYNRKKTKELAHNLVQNNGDITEYNPESNRRNKRLNRIYNRYKAANDNYKLRTLSTEELKRLSPEEQEKYFAEKKNQYAGPIFTGMGAIAGGGMLLGDLIAAPIPTMFTLGAGTEAGYHGKQLGEKIDKSNYGYTNYADGLELAGGLVGGTVGNMTGNAVSSAISNNTITGANWTIKPENWTWDTKFKPVIRSEIPNYNTVDLPYFENKPFSFQLPSGTTPSTLINDVATYGYRGATEYIRDPIRQAAINRDIHIAPLFKNADGAPRFGYITPSHGESRGKISFDVSPTASSSHWLPGKGNGTIVLAVKAIPNGSKLIEHAFHESLHSRGFGADVTTLNDPQVKYGFDAQTPTSNWYNFKTKLMLEDLSKMKTMYKGHWFEPYIEQNAGYISRNSPQGSEFYVNMAHIGKQMDLDPYTPLTERDLNARINAYLQDPKYADKNQFLRYLKHDLDPVTGEIKMRYPGYTWKVLTGQYKYGGKFPNWMTDIQKQQYGGEVIPKQYQQEFNRLNSSNANFISRLKDPNRQIYRFRGDMVYDPKVGTKMPNFTDYGTHQLGYYTDNGKAVITPNIYEDNGQLKYETDWRKAAEHTKQNGDYFETTPEFAEWFTNNYKKYYPGF